jgi:ABC-type amino acid transport system permease subunit
MVPVADINIIILVITLMQGTNHYVNETNHVSKVYSVAAVLYLELVLHVMLFRPWNIFCT